MEFNPLLYTLCNELTKIPSPEANLVVGRKNKYHLLFFLKKKWSKN